jgi:hypothetical protein
MSIFNQEFGIDIVGEDNKTIIHHKVAARVLCVLNDQDAQIAAQEEQQQLAQNPPGYALSSHHQNMASAAGPSNAFSFNGQGPTVAGQRRPAMQPQGLVGMGGSMRPPGKSGLTVDHILNRLQGELQKSRETGAELHSLNGSINEIHDTLGGTLVSRRLVSPLRSYCLTRSSSPIISLHTPKPSPQLWFPNPPPNRLHRQFRLPRSENYSLSYRKPRTPSMVMPTSSTFSIRLSLGAAASSTTLNRSSNSWKRGSGQRTTTAQRGVLQ